MTNFNWGGRGMAFDQGRVRLLADDKDLFSRPIEQNYDFRLFSRSKFPISGTGDLTIRSNEMECNDEDRENLRTMFGQASPFVRPLFGKCLPIVYRFSTDSLSILYVFLRERIEKHKAGGRETPKEVRSSPEEGMDKTLTKCNASLLLDSPRVSGTNSGTRSGVQVVLSTKEVPERYYKGTGKVLNSGGKGTGEVLGSYQRGIAEVLTGSRSTIGYGRDLDKSLVTIASDVHSFSINDLYMNRLFLRCFRSFSEDFGCKVESMIGVEKSGRQIGVNRAALKNAVLMIFCVLFSSLVFTRAVAQERSSSVLRGEVSSAADGQATEGAEAQGSHHFFDFSLYGAVEVRLLTNVQQIEREKRRYAKVDFNKFPIESFKVDADRIPKLEVGQLLPDAVLDMPLRVVNDAYGRDTITLRSCMDRPWIILDIWSESCIPCLASMNNWEELSKTDQSFTLLGVYHSFHAHRAMPETRKKGYGSTQIIGLATEILSRLFLQTKGRLGPTVWIKDGRFFGVSEANTLRDEDYRLLLDGKLNAIPEYALWKAITN